MSIDLSPVFAFPSTLGLDSIEVHDQTIIVHLHATAPTAACPHCGTAGSRVHSRYERTIADVAFGRRCFADRYLPDFRSSAAIRHIQGGSLCARPRHPRNDFRNRGARARLAGRLRRARVLRARRFHGARRIRGRNLERAWNS